MKFNKLVAAGIGSFLAVGLAHASNHCEGYEIRIKNNLAESLIVDKIELTGADLQPSKIFKIEKNSEIVFIANNTTKKMTAELAFHTFSFPRKDLKMYFDLRDGLIRCDYDDKGTEANGVALDSSHSGSKVTYTIG